MGLPGEYTPQPASRYSSSVGFSRICSSTLFNAACLLRDVSTFKRFKVRPQGGGFGIRDSECRKVQVRGTSGSTTGNRPSTYPPHLKSEIVNICGCPHPGAWLTARGTSRRTDVSIYHWFGSHESDDSSIHWRVVNLVLVSRSNSCLNKSTE
ncbi:hypothetical protein BDN71DRAFT_615775 [Pleurotus eryngii]|uniref:Uncharacterized protein n=1 Tax=Pleurotus eryngii TaxID=5323 RepID=A0A9P6DH25_PLEER|nr:hypothetical protein BDN71DRAFT_615775 [Pleurotus eryngii]